MSAATTVASGSIDGWVTGYVIAIAVVLVVVALVLPILKFAHDIGKEAAMIDAALEDSVRNTAGLSGLHTTIEHAQVITAGLNRGRKRLGG